MSRSRSTTAVLVAAGLLMSGCGSTVAGSAQAVGRANAGPVSTGPVSTGPVSTDAVSTDAVSSGAVSTGPVSTGPVTTGPVTTSPVSTGPVSTPASSGASTGASTTGRPAVTGAVNGSATDPREFYARIQAAMKGVTSMSGSMSFQGNAGGIPMNESGPIKATYRDGVVQSMDMQMSMTVQGTSVRFSFRLVGDKAYIGGPAIMSSLGAGASGKQWALLDKKSSNKTLAMLGSMMSSIINFGRSDAMIATIKGARSITKIGPEKVGAVDATKYQAVIDLGALGSALATAMPSQVPRATQGGTSTALYWIDAQDRIVKATSQTEQQGKPLTTEYLVDAYNQPVDIRDPDPATVYTG